MTDEDLYAAIEKRLDALTDMTSGKLDALTGAVRNLAHEAARCNALQTQISIVKADVASLRARCPLCPEKERTSSVPPGT